MDLKEKASYLKGLAEGLEYDKTTKEGKLLAAIIDLLGGITSEIEDMSQDIDYLSDYVDELDKDLGDVEEYVFDDEDDEDDDDYDDDLDFDDGSDECDGICEKCDIEDCTDRSAPSDSSKNS